MAAHFLKRNISRSFGGNILVFLIVALLGVFLMLPLVYSVSSAFKPLDEIFIFPPRLIVRNPTLDNFIQLGLLSSGFWMPFSKYVFNSFFVCITATVGHVLMSSLAAYPLSKLNFIGKGFINWLIRISLLFTTMILYIPQYIVMSEMGIINTYAAMIFPVFQGAIGLYLIQNFMVQIPDSLIEAARIDGAGEMRIFWRIVMPNIKPAWLTATVFAFQGIWNSSGITLMSTLVYDEKIKMLPSLFYQLTSAGTARAGAASALGFILMIPPILLFALSQRRILETMSTSGMK